MSVEGGSDGETEGVSKGVQGDGGRRGGQSGCRKVCMESREGCRAAQRVEEGWRAGVCGGGGKVWRGFQMTEGWKRAGLQYTAEGRAGVDILEGGAPHPR